MATERLCDCGCGRLVTRSPSHVKDGFYFSIDCYSKSCMKQGLTSKTCAKCGKEKLLDEFQIKRENRNGVIIRHAYCNYCLNEYTKKKHQTTHSRWRNAKWRSTSKKGKDWWSITEEEYTPLISLPCHYCGGPLGICGVGLDRKKNDIGYALENVVPCCGTCNKVKNDHFTYEEMLLLAPTLRQIREARKCLLPSDETKRQQNVRK